MCSQDADQVSYVMKKNKYVDQLRIMDGFIRAFDFAAEILESL